MNKDEPIFDFNDRLLKEGRLSKDLVPAFRKYHR